MSEIPQPEDTNGVLALFVSAIFGGALITAMTWFVEGQTSMLVRLIVAWVAGGLLALGAFNHVIVVTIELIFESASGPTFRGHSSPGTSASRRPATSWAESGS